MPFQIIRNDITKVKADAIVNTANPDVIIGDGVDSAIYQAAGKEQLLAAREKIGYLAPGEVGVTPAYQLDAKYIIHVSGIWWKGGGEQEALVLKQCYEHALIKAVELHCESIAFPLLATGCYGFPKELGVQIAVDSFTEFLEFHDMEITLVVFGSESVQLSGNLVDEIRSYIDDTYVEQALKEEYRGVPDRVSGKMRGEAPNGITAEMSVDSLECAEEEKSEDSPQSRKTGRFQMPLFQRRSSGRKGAARESAANESEEDLPNFLGNQMGLASASSVSSESNALFEEQSLDHILKGIYTESFEKYLQQLINKKGLKNSEVYAAANISKQYFSKLLKGQVRPSKEKVLALAVGLRLNMDETVDFLRIAGYALSPISQTDAVVRYFIVHEDYNVLKIDIVLFDYGLDPLSGGA